jgi:hypothetical protein
MIPIGLMFVNSMLQHGFKDLADHLYLSIGLRIVGGGKIMGEA